MVIVKYTWPGQGTNTVLSVLIPSFTPSTKTSHQPRRVYKFKKQIHESVVHFQKPKFCCFYVSVSHTHTKDVNFPHKLTFCNYNTRLVNSVFISYTGIPKRRQYLRFSANPNFSTLQFNRLQHDRPAARASHLCCVMFLQWHIFHPCAITDLHNCT